MAFKNNCIATVWEIDKTNHKVVEMHEKFAEISISTSKQNKQTKQYENDFSARIRLVGQAFDKIKEISLNPKEKIRLLNVEVTNKYDAIKRVIYTNYVCWDFELLSSNDNKPKKVEVVESDKAFDINDDDLPF